MKLEKLEEKLNNLGRGMTFLLSLVAVIISSTVIVWLLGILQDVGFFGFILFSLIISFIFPLYTVYILAFIALSFKSLWESIFWSEYHNDGE